MIRRVFAVAYFCFLVCGAIQLVQAMDPALGAITPVGIQRGVETEVIINGARLSDAEQFLFYTPGFEVKKLEVVNDNTVKVLVAVSAECTPGIHALRVKTATGISKRARKVSAR